MNLGEIKIQALSLMYPDTVIRYDDSTDEGVENAVYELKANHNFSGLLDSSIGAINRAFSQIEARGLSLIKCADRAYSLCEPLGNGRVAIEVEKDFVSIERLLCHRGDKTYACGYEVVGNKIYAHMVGDVYTVVYFTALPKIARTTRDSLEIDLPRGVCEAIPYFVMAELVGAENEQRAREAREEFYKMLDSCEKSRAHCHQCFQIIYSME